MSKTVLVVIAHEDDEVLGLGGSIARHVAEGDKVWCVSFTTGLRSREGVTDADIDRRHEHAQAAADVLGFRWYGSHDFPDNRMDSVDLLDVVQVIEYAIDDLKPELVYTHHGGDLNIDHRRVHDATMTAIRRLPEQVVHEVRCMEVPSSTEFSKTPFIPNLWIALTEDQAARKHMALSCYTDELRQWPHPRCHEAIGYLELRRAVEGGVGPLAEAFNVISRRIL